MRELDKKNDIVFTPDYIADFMCRLAHVSDESVVLDNCCGSGALMQAAARAGAEHIAGVEFEDIPFNMLQEALGDDARFEYIQGDGLKYNEILKTAGFNTLLINPPYSADFGGFIFADKCMREMPDGYAVVLTKTSAQMPQLLDHSTLLASIKMPDILKGYSSVSATIFLFKCGRPHNIDEDFVTFIDMTEDGYKRSGRKSQKAKHQPGPDSAERYDEVYNIINGNIKESDIKFFKDCYIKDTLKEKTQWTYDAHRVIDIMPTIDDFRKTVADYLDWKVSQILKGNM